jgi:hypothetical protein
MKNHKEVAESTWFRLIGEKLLVVVLLALLAPAFRAMELIDAAHYWRGGIILTGWVLVVGGALWALHRQGYLRLIVSLPCALLGLLAAYLAVFGA